MPFSLTNEEIFLWDAANHWRTPEKTSFPPSLDWARIAEIGVPNRMATLLRRVLAARRMWDSIPDAPRSEIEASANRLQDNAVMMSEALAEYLRRANERGIETVVLKGLSISNNVYGDPAMRPGGDIDILVRREHVQLSIEILDGMGVGAFWPNLMADPYYERHHLHQQRCTPDLKIWFEIHWALDHPYTLFTIDYEAMMKRTRRGELLGQPVNELLLPDLLLSLAVHLVKHAIYLPSTYHRPDLARGILADGMLMYYLDIAELIKQSTDEMDWDAVIHLARESGTVDVFGSVLQVCCVLLDALVPEQVLNSLPVQGGRSGPLRALTHRMMNRVLEREIAQYLGELPNKFWDTMLITNGAFILRPIRLVETTPYFFAPSEFLRRKYGQDNLFTGIGHFARAMGQFAWFGCDSVYFAVERYWRLKRIGYSTSLFNKLGTEG